MCIFIIFFLFSFLINIFNACLFSEKEKKKERKEKYIFRFLITYYIFSDQLLFLFVKIISMYNITRNSFSIEKEIKSMISATRLCYCFYLNIFLFSTLNYRTILKKKASRRRR